MTFYADEVTLLDRTSVNRLPVTIGGVIDNGDLKPWRIRLSITNTGVDGKVNFGEIKLFIDNRKTFIQASPILIDDEAKNRYLIEAKIVQRNPSGGADLESKVFRFQLGSPTITTSPTGGYILSITLQELQYRFKEAITSRELRFYTPKDAFFQRLLDFNNHQFSGGIGVVQNSNQLPDNESLSQEYIPQSPQPISKLVDDIFKNLSEPAPLGGTFTDFYYDFDPDANITLGIGVTADEIGREATGVVVDPLSLDPVASDDEQDTIVDYLRYKNHIIMRGTPDGGSLPIEHSKFGSKWLHAKLRPEWEVGNDVINRSGVHKQYLQGDTVKKTIVLGSGKKVVRFFLAKSDVPLASGTPEANTTYWTEDFVIYPEFNQYGRYYEGDIVYHDNGSSIKFYQASENIHDFSLNRYRRWEVTGTYSPAGHLNTALGYLKSPPTAGSGWTYLGGTVADHLLTDFAGWFSYSPWTNDLFAWETNMVGIKGDTTILPNATDNRYVGFVPDWDISKDVYEKQDETDEFESISVKWIHKIDINTPLQLTTEEKYHGQRVLVGIAPVGDFAGAPAGCVAQYDITKSGANKWRFSRAPIDGDVVTTFTGKVYQRVGGVWKVAWEVERLLVTSSTDMPASPSSPMGMFHLVKDMYFTKGHEGTPSNAIELRFAWDVDRTNIPNASDTINEKAKFARLNSRGAWMWFWNPFPRLPTTETGLAIGGIYGHNGNYSAIQSGFTTLNIYNNSTDRFQTMLGWNNGINTEDMGKISGIAFKQKVGIYSDPVSIGNDDNFHELEAPSNGVPNIPMIFWCIDMFDRIWFKKYVLRKNATWDDVVIQFGDLSQSNLHIPRWDELVKFGNIPLTFTDYSKKEKTYTGVAFDWRFVRGWGTFYSNSYDDAGFYNAGIDSFWKTLEQTAKQFVSFTAQLLERAKQFADDIGASITSGRFNVSESKPLVSDLQRQATIAIDGLHYIKELIVNSDDSVVSNARTQVEYMGNIGDYEALKIIARGKKNRLSFFPRFFHIGSIGDVRMRIGKSFKIKGDRIPDHPSQYTAWSGATSYVVNNKVSYGGYSWRAKQSSTNKQPDTNPEYWENLNELACAEVTHIIDHSGYRMEVMGRRKFYATGEL